MRGCWFIQSAVSGWFPKKSFWHNWIHEFMKAGEDNHVHTKVSPHKYSLWQTLFVDWHLFHAQYIIASASQDINVNSYHYSKIPFILHETTNKFWSFGLVSLKIIPPPPPIKCCALDEIVCNIDRFVFAKCFTKRECVRGMCLWNASRLTCCQRIMPSLHCGSYSDWFNIMWVITCRST